MTVPQPMVQRTYRIPRPLYVAARRLADDRRESMSQVIRAALVTYTETATERESA